MGRDEGPIAKADNGAPLWPAGLVGSITHTQGYAAALAARAGDFAGLGVDAERIGGVTEDLWPRLFDAGERGRSRAGRRTPPSLPRCCSAPRKPVTRRGGESVLRFHDLHVVLADKRFTARCGEQQFEGRYAVARRLMLTAAWRR